MNKLLKARKVFAQSSTKGFTLVELIVVIVIIAILVAALTPAILGVISRANRVADEADARSVMMAGSVAAMSQSGPPSAPGATAIRNELTGASNVQAATYIVYFDGPIAVGATIKAGSGGTGGGSRTGEDVSIGVVTSTSTSGGTITSVPVTIPS